jgi:hypothetical protein
MNDFTYNNKYKQICNVEFINAVSNVMSNVIKSNVIKSNAIKSNVITGNVIISNAIISNAIISNVIISNDTFMKYNKYCHYK